ncbi:MAG: manganese efflux pump MntP family protein [Syntrophomonadaceae bacterium]|nr:manganese efflux pump MntP family protein [Syntrophomonadaceae bacterium]
MGILELTLIAIGLAMDAFAVALCKGLKMRELNYRHAAIIAVFFGGFQALMPLLGWLLGKQFERYIVNIDHWIAFALLLFIGGKMIMEALKYDHDPGPQISILDVKELLLLSVATSIDALAVGITLAFLQTAILPAVALIGIITFAIALAGVIIGHRFGIRYKSKAEIFGGAVLILIGVKILLEHLGIWG